MPSGANLEMRSMLGAVPFKGLTMPASISHIRTLSRIITHMRAVEADIPASYMAVLLYVARHKIERGEDPISADVSAHTGIARPSMSRIIRSLSDQRIGASRVGEERPKGSRESLKLLEKIDDPVDLRMVRLRLTPKGTALLDRLGDALDTYGETTSKGS